MRRDEATVTEMGNSSFCGADSFQEHLGEWKKSVGEGWQPRDTTVRREEAQTTYSTRSRCPCPTKVTCVAMSSYPH